MKKTKKQFRKVNKKHESGRSMIEMVGVLAVMGLITAAAFVLITSAMRSQKISRADDDVAAIAAGVRLLYNTSPDFAGLDNDASGEGTLEVLGYKNVTPPYGSGSYKIAAAECEDQSGKKDCFIVSFPVGSDDNAANQCKTLGGRTWVGTGTGACENTPTDENPTLWTVKIKFGKE